MEKIFIGYVQGFHGLKGEMKIKNKFSDPSKVFKKGIKIFLNDENHSITNVRYHKGFYLIEIDELNDINKVEKYKGFNLYVLREELCLRDDEYLKEDLIGMEIIFEEEVCGKVKHFVNNNGQDLLEVESDKNYYIPLVDAFIVKVDLNARKIYTKDIRGLML